MRYPLCHVTDMTSARRVPRDPELPTVRVAYTIGRMATRLSSLVTASQMPFTIRWQ